jgi:hypothetical protein
MHRARIAKACEEPVSDSRSAPDSDLPWLQEVEDEDAPRGISAGRMVIGLLVVLAVAAAVTGAFFWLGSRDPVSGAPELIRAPESPYKVRPKDPGGLDVAGESQTTFETSAGQDIDSRLNLPQAQQPQEQPQGTGEAPPSEAKAPAPAVEPAPAPSGASGSVIQLGAYKNTAQAERAWTALSNRFSALSGLTKIVVPYSAGGNSGYRLRAAASSPQAARQVCQALQAAGESCFVAK